MIEAKLALALVNKPGWEPVHFASSLTYKGCNVGRYVGGPFPFHTLVVGEIDFQDKCIIYNVVLDHYYRLYQGDELYSLITCVNMTFQPVSEAEFHGVVVMVLFDMPIIFDFGVRKHLTL